jgi:Tfp pilus assembly protein PilF
LRSFAKLVLALTPISVVLGQTDRALAALDEAAADFEQGRTAEAGQKLDAILKDHPLELRVLVLKAAVLDSLDRHAEAESYYQRALKLAPGSAQVLNNAANHYLASGDRQRARELYLKAIAADPQHVNANLQLAQMSVEEKLGSEALDYLNRVGDAANSDVALLVRAQALALTGRCTDAGSLLESLEGQAGGGPSLFFSTGLAFAGCKKYDEAERSFSRALDADPRNPEILHNLGLAALEAGHAARATAVFETALKERPDDPDSLYALARAYLKQERPVDAASLLTKAQKLASGRAEIVLLLAQVTAKLELFRDAATAYDEYLKLKPADAVARRERAFTLACANRSKSALADLEWYAKEHPHDATGWYELSMVQSFEDRPVALKSLGRSLTLEPGLSPARYARALLNLEEQNPAAAIDDLRLYLEQQPQDYRAMAHLGKAYLAVGRVNDAVDVLKRAMEIAPDAPLVLVMYRRALVQAGRADEASMILSRLKQTGTAGEGPRPQAGLIGYLSFSLTAGLHDAFQIGPAIGAMATGFSMLDQFGQRRTMESLMGPQGLVLVFFRSADW